MNDKMSLPPSSAPSAAESILPLPPPGYGEFPPPDVSEELGESLVLILRVGSLLACSGAAAFRVRDAMHRVAKALSVGRAEFAVAVDSIVASVFDGHQFRTQIVRLPPLGVDMNLLCRIELATRHLDRLTPSDLHQRLDALQKAPRLYPQWLSILSLGAACGAFCAAGGGNLPRVACTFAGAAAGHSLRLWMLMHHKPLVSIVVSSAFCAALLSTLLVWATHLAGTGAVREVLDLATLSSVLFLIPGVPLVNSIVDLVHLDVTAAMGRAAYAAVLVGAIALGLFGFIVAVRIVSAMVGWG